MCYCYVVAFKFAILKQTIAFYNATLQFFMKNNGHVLIEEGMMIMKKKEDRGLEEEEEEYTIKHILHICLFILTG